MWTPMILPNQVINSVKLESSVVKYRMVSKLGQYSSYPEVKSSGRVCENLLPSNKVKFAVPRFRQQTLKRKSKFHKLPLLQREIKL